MKIVHRSGKANVNADALSRNPHLPAPQEGIGQTDTQVLSSAVQVSMLVQIDPAKPLSMVSSFSEEQRKDPKILEIVRFLEKEELPQEEERARKVALQSPLFILVDDTLFFVDSKSGGRRRAVVPKHLQGQIMEEAH